MIGEWLPDGLQDCWQGLELGAEADCATSLNSAGEGGRTMLHVAVDRGLTAVVNWLIQRGGNVDAKDHTGSTPLHVAAAGGNSRLLGLLIKRCSDRRSGQPRQDPLTCGCRAQSRSVHRGASHRKGCEGANERQAWTDAVAYGCHAPSQGPHFAAAEKRRRHNCHGCDGTVATGLCA